MSVPTYLNYTCVPTLLKIGETQDLLIIGTLKTPAQLGDTIDSVSIQSLVLNFGNLGNDADNISNTPLEPSQVEIPPDWKVTCQGVKCTLSPAEGSEEVSNNAIVIKLKGVKVNATTGNVSLTITEVASANAQPGQKVDTRSFTGTQTTVLPKVKEKEYQPVLTVQPKELKAGQNCTLSWSGGDPEASYALEYIYRNQLQKCTTHGNQDALGHTDFYPDPSKGDPYLIPDAVTHFILTILSSGKPSQVGTAVLVSQPSLHAQSLHVQYPNSAGENGILISSQEVTEGQAGNGITIVCNDDSPADPLSILKATGEQLLHVDKSANTNIMGTLAAGTTNINGNLTVTGNNNTFNGDLNVKGNLTINGNIVINGRGAKTYIGTLNNDNQFKFPELFVQHDHYQFEFVFHEAKPLKQQDRAFGVRLYSKGTGLNMNSHYQSILYGIDKNGQDREYYKDMTFLRLYADKRTGPDRTLGLFGKMTMYKSQNGFSVSALLHAPIAEDGHSCQVWTEGGFYPMKSQDLEGIEFNFYSSESYNMNGGWIDIYGYS